MDERGAGIHHGGRSVLVAFPGHDRPGQERRIAVMQVDEASLKWEVQGRCGFASDFDYTADER